MINVSNAFKQELFNDRRDYLEYVDTTLKDGTVLNLKNKDLWGGGMTIEDAVSKDNSFDVGSAIINKCTVVINNIYDDYSQYDFGDAKVVAYVGLNIPDGTTERIRKGTYTVDETAYNGSIITLQCLDNMKKFDKPYSESQLIYPATLNQIVRDACDVCGVPLQTYHFPHDSFIVQTRPNGETTTFREVISWCAQIAGCFCRCDTLGRLELKWYDQKTLEKAGLDGGIFDSLNSNRYMTGDNADGGSFNPWNTGYAYDGGEFGDRNNVHYIYSNYSLDISTDDVVITGVKVVEKNKEENQDALTTYQSGTEGYVVSVENNELIKGGAGQTIVGWLGEQLIGFRFRKANITHASDPTIEAGDVGFLIDRKQNTYRIVVSSTKFSTGSNQKTTSSAKNPARNSAARFSAETKNYVELRKDIEKEKTDREKALGELQTRIDNSSGLFTTEVTQPDGSTIFYMHDKPTLAESMIVWKMTAEAFAVSTDGGKTYNAGLTVDGDLIARILSVTGFYFDWAKGGTLTLGGDNNENGEIQILNSAGKVIGTWNSSGLKTNVAELSDNVIWRLIDKRAGTSNQSWGWYTSEYDVFKTKVFSYPNETERYGFGISLERYVLGVKEKSTIYISPGVNTTNIPGITDAGHQANLIMSKDALYIANDYTNHGVSEIIYCVYDKGKIRIVREYMRDNVHYTYEIASFSYVGSQLKGESVSLTGDESVYLKAPTIQCEATTSFSMKGPLDTTGTETTYLTYDSFTKKWELRSSSSLRYKNIDRDMNEDDILPLYEIKPVFASYKENHIKKEDQRYGKSFPMLIAEDVQKYFPDAVDLNSDLEAETWNERVLIPAMFQMIKSQKEHIDNLTERLERLESLLLKEGDQ